MTTLSVTCAMQTLFQGQPELHYEPYNTIGRRGKKNSKLRYNFPSSTF